MQRTTVMFIFTATLALAGCQGVPWAKPISLESPEAERVKAALANWPQVSKDDVLRRPFFLTLHVAGLRTTASGILEYHGPRDFRVTAATEMGAILFDGRVNWGGATVLRHMAGVDTGAIEAMLRDMVRAFDLPTDLDGLKAGDTQLEISRELADAHRYTWIFDRADGRLLQTQVDLGLLDVLRINYDGYSARGWPKELQVTRRARLYDVSFTFTDEAVAGGQGK